MLELGSSLTGSALVTGFTAVVDAVVLGRFVLDPGIEMFVSIIGALELELSRGGSWLDIVSTINLLWNL